MSTSMDKLSKTCEDLQLRSMNRNIVIHNIQERQGEDIYETVADVFRNKLKIPEHLLHSNHNPSAPVQIDVAHRLGRSGVKARPIVVQLVLRRGKDVIFGHVKNLKGSRVSISEQLPSEMRERRDAQFMKYKQLREEHQNNQSVRVKLTKDKLLLNNKIVENNFERNSLSTASPPEIYPIRFQDILHTDVSEYSQSYFQGHLNTVTSIAEAKASLSALLQNSDVAKAHHITYAYSILDGGNTTDGQSDDGEIGASDILQTIIKEKGLTNIFVAVSRCHSGPNIGKKRFEMIKTAALNVISKMDA